MTYNIPSIEILREPQLSKSGEYVVNIHRDGEYQFSMKFWGFTGHEVADEVFSLKRRYPKSEGFSISW